jgi:hypothetical protein
VASSRATGSGCGSTGTPDGGAQCLVGEALVFDGAGNMYRGNLANTAAFVMQKGGEMLVNFDKLKQIN